MKDLKKRIESNISTPIIWYAIILATAVVFLVISSIITHFTSDSNWWGLLLLNFGYGTFASLVVSLLIDIGNTKRSKDEQNKQYMFLHSNLISEAKSLGKMMMFAVEKHSNGEFDRGKNYNLNELIESVLKKDSLLDKRIVYLKDSIERIKTQCNYLIDNSVYFYSNPKITNEYIDNLKKINKICISINFRITTPALINEGINEKEIKTFILDNLIPAIDAITDNEISNYYNQKTFKATEIISF